MGFASACGSEVWGFGVAVIGPVETGPFRFVPQQNVCTEEARSGIELAPKGRRSEPGCESMTQSAMPMFVAR